MFLFHKGIPTVAVLQDQQLCFSFTFYLNLNYSSSPGKYHPWRKADPVKADRNPTMCCMWLNVNFNINPPTQWSCCYPGFIRLITRKWKRCYPSPACWGTQLHVSAWSQPYPSSFMTTAKPWEQKTSTPAHRFEMQQLPKQIVTLCFLQLCPFLCKPHDCLAAVEVQCKTPQHLLASVPKTLLSSPSHLLPWCQSKLEHCSELVLSSLCSQPVPRDTFLWVPEASQEEKNLLELPHASQAVLQAKVRSSFLELSVPQFHTLCCGTTWGGKTLTPFI